MKPSYVPQPNTQPAFVPSRREEQPLYAPSMPEFRPAELPDKSDKEMPEGMCVCSTSIQVYGACTCTDTKKHTGATKQR